nr:uncharacterized protein LOC112033333 [Quercus suber]POE98640.1 hypothetical protein CFP56_66612 [Quercus suber]
MTRLGRMAAGARNILNKNEGWDFTECRMKLKKFLYGEKYQTHECLAESVEKKVKKFFSGKKDIGKVQGNDISSSVEKVDGGSGDHQEDAKKNKGAAEMGLKGVGKMVSVRDKSLKAGAAEIGRSMLGLDGIESMENVKQILSQMELLEGKMDAGFQRLELLIKSRCGRGGPRPPQSGSGGGGPRPPQSGSGGGSGSDEDGGIDIGE